jgi:hypothetical protein
VTGSAPDGRRVPELRAAGVLVGGLAVLGAVVGLIWQLWSPARPLAYVVDVRTVGKIFSVPQLQPAESESFAASDGRFMILMLGVGVLAGLGTWSARAIRGALAVLALAVGALAGAGVAALVGHATGGGQGSGPAGTVIRATLSVHMYGLLFVQAAAAVLVYALCVAFAAQDDLGRPDPARDRARCSVGLTVQLQDAGGDRDGPGRPQQGQLPAQ